MNEEEKKVVEQLKKTSKGRTIIPIDEILIAVNLIEKLQKENEQLQTEVNSLKEDNEKYQELELQILESEE